MPVIAPKCSFFVRGDDDDIRNLVEKLNTPFWQQKGLVAAASANTAVIAYVEWDHITDLVTLADHAKSLIRLFRAALLLLDGCMPFEFAGAQIQQPDGTFLGISNAAVAVVYPRASDRAAPELFENVFSVATQKYELLTALEYFEAPQDWYNLYKCIEAMYAVYGGEHKFLARNFSTTIKDIKDHANFHRHFKSEGKAPRISMKYADCRDEVERVLKVVVSDLSPTR